MTGKGRVYLVGAGPGDPGLLTLRGRECLAEADAVLYDYLVNPRLLERAPDAEKICLGQHGRAKIWTQAEINERLAALAEEGRRVVRLKSGDPTVFARGAEEAEALAARQVPVEIVPGVTSALAAAACAGIPLTHRDFASAVALVTGHERDGKADGLDFARLAQFPGTLAIYMGVTTAARWSRRLMEAGMAPGTPAALIRRISFPDQRTWCGTLREIAGHIESSQLRPPVIALIGPAAEQQAALGWFESRPLFGQRVLVTRPRHSADRLARQLEELGAEVWTQPAIEVAPLKDLSAVDETVGQVRQGRWDWVVFASPNGVRYWMDRLLTQADVRALGGRQIAAVGAATAQALGEYRVTPDLVPEDSHAEGLAAALLKREQRRPSGRSARVLLVRASRGRDVLRDQLQAAGLETRQVAAYQNRDVERPDPQVAERMEQGGFDWVTVTSSAIGRSLHRMFGERLKHTQLASISPITSEALHAVGLRPAAEAVEHNMDGVVSAIVAAVAGEAPA